MCAWIKAGMHHIFHGVVTRVMSLFEQFFKDEDKNTEFEALVNPHLLEIASLRLDWLHVRPLPKTLWLTKDELGFSRIMTFVYGQFSLYIRLRETTNTTKNTLLALRKLLVLLQVVTALLMSPREPAVEVINRHMKVFLSCCHRFCQLHYAAGKVSFWAAATSNFPSLLNLPTQIKKYGLIRWYWEGTRERYIQTVKTVLVSMRKTTSYFVRKMEAMQKLTTMAWLKGQIGRRKGARHSRYIGRNYFRYL